MGSEWKKAALLVDVNRDGLEDRPLFTLSEDEWNELQRLLDRPLVPKPRLAALLSKPSMLDSE